MGKIKQLAIIAIILAAFSIPSFSHADTIYSQTSDDSGEWPADGGTIDAGNLVGFVDLLNNVTITGSTTLNITTKDNSGFCNTSGGGGYYVGLSASSTAYVAAVFEKVIQWQPAVSGSYQIRTRTRLQEGYSDSFTLPAGSYYIMAWSQCSGSDYYLKTDDTGANMYGWITTEGEEPATDRRTRIIDFDPQDGDVSSTTVNFSIDAYINSEDIGYFKGITVRLKNINQNFLGYVIPNFLDPNEITLVNEDITDGGFYSTSTTAVLDEGNYRVEACLIRNYEFAGFYVYNPLSNVVDNANDCLSHQFIVGESTFVGNISQNSWSQFNGIINGQSATSTEALAQTCSPISNNVSTAFLNPGFHIPTCATFLFVPDSYYLNQSMTSFRDGVLTRAPWGYLNRTFTIMTASTTQNLPTYTIPVMIGSNDNHSTTTFTFDINDMMLGGAELAGSITDPYSGKTGREIAEPFLQLSLAISVLFIIIKDLTGSHKHEEHNGGRNTKLS